MSKLNLQARINILAKELFSSGNEVAAMKLNSLAKDVAKLKKERDSLHEQVDSFERRMRSVPSKFKL